ncbi:MAG: hypothetical protein ABSF43_07540 [Rectinemataceae bacterium]|jgi:hypothetical protein
MPIVFALLLMSCVTMSLYDAGNLKKGMTAEEVKAVLPVAPKYSFPVETEESNPQVIVVNTYILSTGSYASNYYLAFRGDHLFFWGYPHEFARSSDPLINDVGEKANAMLKKIAEAK